METKGWDVFRNLPPEQDSGSEAMNKRCLAITVRTLKVITYIVSFAIVLAGCVMSKGTMLFMTSQIRPHKTILFCNKDLERDKQYQAEISTPEQVRTLFDGFGLEPNAVSPCSDIAGLCIPFSCYYIALLRTIYIS